ncbi:chorismate mutase [Marinilactibacillus psychrotolerans]|uniref:Chorismate mutase n=2 Tax=Marinilactibacillus psychrotolerans TaxID=191770 RepID=A0A511GYR8_9LACT|nr:chorismate mutase [Marinilactibacillus psychrotolerans]TLQ06892.1 chorismate mutase [Marinilactibacillus psychrotolerans]SDD15993.1 chorismate mutase [Marinilactibacillus psychrotolerans]SJN24269.1 Chorismate mutase I \
MSELEQYRQGIDAIDQDLTRLFEARLKTVLKVGEYKKEHNLPVLDASREQKVIAKNVNRLEDKQFEEELTKFFQSMMDITKETQTKMMKS